MKSEPEVFSISHLKREGVTWWEGIRNYQARNFMMNDMRVGDLVLFYHSNAEPPGVAGIAQVSKLAEPDQSQFDKKNEYFDPKATKEKPIWYCVQIKFVSQFNNIIALDQLRLQKGLSEMQVLKKGQRLSVQPVTPQEFEIVKKLGG